MQNLKILNKKEIKRILSLIKKQWNADLKLDYVFLVNEKNKLYLANKELFKLNFNKTRINSIGVYFGELKNRLRLSIEGSQIIGKEAKKNIVEVDEEKAKQWLKGEDIETDKDLEGFVIIKHKKDFLGTGKFKENKILNFVPKERRIKAF